MHLQHVLGCDRFAVHILFSWLEAVNIVHGILLTYCQKSTMERRKRKSEILIYQ